MKHFLTILLALCLTLVVCGALADVTVTDMKGREVTLEAPAARVIALQPADAEIIWALGAQNVLVGRGAYVDYPAEVLDLPQVNSGSETNIEEILALEPDVIVMATMDQTEEQVNSLAEAGVKVIVTEAQSVEGVYEAIRLIGAVLGKDAEAEALVSGMQESFAALAGEDGRSVYYEISGIYEGSTWAAGAGTFMDEIGAMMGLKNIYADVEGWAPVSVEETISRNPEIIVTTNMWNDLGLDPVAEIMQRDGWADVDAIRNQAVWYGSDSEFTRPGPRLVDAAQHLKEFLDTLEALAPAA